jgi:hypothetical protein
MLVIAALPREGRVQRAIRRCFIAGNGRPRSSADFLRWAYPKLDHLLKCAMLAVDLAEVVQ